MKIINDIVDKKFEINDKLISIISNNVESIKEEDKNKFTELLNEFETIKKKEYKSEKNQLIFLIVLLFVGIVFILISFKEIKSVFFETNSILTNSIISIDTVSSISFHSDTTSIYRYIKTRNDLDSVKNLLSIKEHDFLELKLSLIENNYGIRFMMKNDTLSISAPRVDSALILYNVYKDKLKYNKEKQYWEIK